MDWVLIDIITPNGPVENLEFEIVGRKAGFILKNGFIRDIDGGSLLTVDVYTTSGLYVCLHHRNHLSVISLK